MFTLAVSDTQLRLRRRRCLPTPENARSGQQHIDGPDGRVHAGCAPRFRQLRRHQKHHVHWLTVAGMVLSPSPEDDDPRVRGDKVVRETRVKRDVQRLRKLVAPQGYEHLVVMFWAGWSGEQQNPKAVVVLKGSGIRGYKQDVWIGATGDGAAQRGQACYAVHQNRREMAARRLE
jgi:hypothetical protein